MTLHGSDPHKEKARRKTQCRHGQCKCAHFGVHLSREAFDEVKKRCIEHNVEFIDKPYLRFEGTDLEQETMFIADPHGNAMEIKTMKNPEELWKIQSKQN